MTAIPFLAPFEGSETEEKQILEVWEESVRTTHTFLAEKDIMALKPLVADALSQMEHVVLLKNGSGGIDGFMGILDKKLEMLFLRPSIQGSGMGKAMLQHAITVFHICRVDVNEQNPQAIGFYEYMGFSVVGRSAKDEQGNPFPIVHMRLISPECTPPE